MIQTPVKFIMVALTHGLIEDELRQYGLTPDNPYVQAVTVADELPDALALPEGTKWCLVEFGRSDVITPLVHRFGFNTKIPDAIRLLNDEIVPPAYRPRKGP